MGRLFQKKEKLLTNVIKIPKELVFGESVITIRGNHEIFIENYKGILECTNQFVWVSAKNLRIGIEGEELSVGYYNNDEMKVIGTIHQISFME